MAKESRDLPSDCFQHISVWHENIDIDQLKTEYIQLKNNIYELLKNYNYLPSFVTILAMYRLQKTDIDDMSDCSSHDGTANIMDKSIDFNKNVTITNVIKLLTKYGLDSAFPNLLIAYIALATIRASTASAKRSFSKAAFSFAKLVILNKN